MSHPALWAGLLAAREIVLGLALVIGGRLALPGLVGVIAFHLALMLFGWGVWLWSVPALVGLVWLARSQANGGSSRVPASRRRVAEQA